MVPIKYLYNERYNLDLQVKQNLFSAAFGLEKSNVPTKYKNLPKLLKGEDLHIKSGQVGLMTDNAQGTMFDNFRVDHEDCFVDPFDSDRAKRYKVRTNRFIELYKNDVNQVYEQNPNETNNWLYKDNHFGRKNCLWRRPADNEKLLPALLSNKVFDIGTVAFALLLSKPETVFFTYLFYTSQRNTFVVSISASKIRITQIENNQPQILLSQKIDVKLYTWT